MSCNHEKKSGPKHFDVAALGELLIDFTPAGVSAAGMNLYERNPGGAPANVLCALARLGAQTAFLGKVGEDAPGAFLRDVLLKNHIDTRGLCIDPHIFTTLAFVDLEASGERHFSFARKPGADTALREDELDTGVLENCRIFHFGSLSLTDEPARGATKKAIQIARNAGALISYDPNYRAPLWRSEDTAIEMMLSVLGDADVLKVSEEEAALLTGKSEPKDAAQTLLDSGVPCVVITLGKEGAMLFTKTVALYQKPPLVPVVDTTGAGDAFWGGFLYHVLNTPVMFDRFSEDDLKKALVFGNTAASFCVQKRGAIPAMPTREEVNAALPAYKAP